MVKKKKKREEPERTLKPKKKEKRNRWSRGGLSFSIMAAIKKEPFAFFH